MVKSFCDKAADNIIFPIYKYTMKVLGPTMLLLLYALIGLHVYAFFGFIMGLLKKRLGAW